MSMNEFIFNMKCIIAWLKNIVILFRDIWHNTVDVKDMQH